MTTNILVGDKGGYLAQKRNDRKCAWAECSTFRKGSPKVKKCFKKVLTILWDFDRIYKSHGALAQAALNLENDTDEITQDYDSNSE